MVGHPYLDTLSIINDRSLSWLGTDTSIKSGGVKLVLWAQTSPLIEMMQSCKCFPHVNKIFKNIEKKCEYMDRCYLCLFYMNIHMYNFVSLNAILT